MSIWTHVAGTIRFDALRFPGIPHDNPKTWIGPTNLWDEDNENSTVPAGSEGSLNYTVYENPDPSHMAAYTVTIFGDLRDYSSTEEIRQWLETVTNGQLVRQGIVHCEVEQQGAVIFEYVCEKGWMSSDGCEGT